MIVTVISELKVYEVDGENAPYDTSIKVQSHWNSSDLVVLCIDGKTYTVLARDLKAAVQNAGNVGV